jgi:hypothetical protein
MYAPFPFQIPNALEYLGKSSPHLRDAHRDRAGGCPFVGGRLYPGERVPISHRPMRSITARSVLEVRAIASRQVGRGG